MNKNRILSLDDMSKILCHDTPTIRKYAKMGILPTIEGDGESLFFSEKKIAEHFGLENLKEPFITLEKASEISGMSPNTLTGNCAKAKNPCPHHRLKNAKGSKLLFIESELREWLKFGLIVSFGYKNLRQKYDMLLEVLGRILENNELALELFQEREVEVAKQVFIENKSLEEIARDLNRDKETVRQILEKFCRRLTYRIRILAKIFKEKEDLQRRLYEMGGDFESLKHAYNKILSENKVFRAKLGFIDETKEDEKIINERKHLLTPIEDLDLSVRAYNCLKDANIRTLGVIVSHDESYYLKLKNFGKKTLVELKELVSMKGWELGIKTH